MAGGVEGIDRQPVGRGWLEIAISKVANVRADHNRAVVIEAKHIAGHAGVVEGRRPLNVSFVAGDSRCLESRHWPGGLDVAGAVAGGDGRCGYDLFGETRARPLE